MQEPRESEIPDSGTHFRHPEEHFPASNLRELSEHRCTGEDNRSRKRRRWLYWKERFIVYIDVSQRFDVDGDVDGASLSSEGENSPSKMYRRILSGKHHRKRSARLRVRGKAVEEQATSRCESVRAGERRSSEELHGGVDGYEEYPSQELGQNSCFRLRSRQAGKRVHGAGL